MSVLVVGLLTAVFVGALVLAAFEWVRVVVGAFRWAEALFKAHGAPSPDSQPIADPGSGGHPQGAQRPPTKEGVDGRGGIGYPARHYLLDVGSFVALGVALDPDFESFFGGFATAVAAGGVLLIAVVVVMAVRRFTSF